MATRRPRTPKAAQPNLEENQPESRSVKTEIGPVETKEQPQPYIHEVAPSGLILEANEPVRVEGEVVGHEVVVSRPVYRRVFPPSAKRPSYLLVYPSGARVPKSILQQL